MQCFQRFSSSLFYAWKERNISVYFIEKDSDILLLRREFIQYYVGIELKNIKI